MEFYEISDALFSNDLFEENAFKKLPEDIRKNIRKFQSDICKNNRVISKAKALNSIWNIVEDICEDYIKIDWFSNLGIDKKELKEDIKNHAIFMIFLALENRNEKVKSINENLKPYLEEKRSRKKSKDKFKNDLEKWLKNEKGNYMYREWLDFKIKEFECEDNDENDKCKDIGEKYVDSSFDIFYKTFSEWKNCIFNERHYYGIEFNKLVKFYNLLIDNRDGFNINQIKENFMVERYFSGNFICDIYNYLIGEYFKAIKSVDIERNAHALEIHKLDNIQVNEAEKLFYLVQLANTPLVFARSKYIDNICKKYDIESNYKEGELYNISKYISKSCKFEGELFYLNRYLIPIMIKTYYSLLWLYMNRGIELEPIIETRKTLIMYINENSKIYNINKIDKWKYRNNYIAKAMQVNLTHTFFRYCGEQKVIYNYEDVLKIMKDKEKDLKRKSEPNTFQQGIYDRHFYQYPFNQIFNEYQVYNEYMK